MQDWTVYEVFIASPLQMDEVRDAVEKCVSEWPDHETTKSILLPRRWEALPGQLEVNVQEYINRAQVERADILIAIFDERMGSGGTLNEIELFVSNGKAQGAMVYFSSASRADPALKELQEQLYNRGLVKEFNDVNHLVAMVRKDLTSCVSRIKGGRLRNWPRLQQAVAEINNVAPYPLAHYLTDRLLEGSASEMELIEFEVRRFKSLGLGGYIEAVHNRLTTEARQGTKVLAICGEKGLRGYNELDGYFRRFYEFAEQGVQANSNPHEIQVVRVFVEQGQGPTHSNDVERVINDHTAQRGVVALRVPRASRDRVNEDFPGICEALDFGFGVVIFMPKDKPNAAIVHQGRSSSLSFAVFDRDVVVRHLIKLTRKIYEKSTEYENNTNNMRQNIDALFQGFIT